MYDLGLSENNTFSKSIAGHTGVGWANPQRISEQNGGGIVSRSLIWYIYIYSTIYTQIFNVTTVGKGGGAAPPTTPPSPYTITPFAYTITQFAYTITQFAYTIILYWGLLYAAFVWLCLYVYMYICICVYMYMAEGAIWSSYTIYIYTHRFPSLPQTITFCVHGLAEM